MALFDVEAVEARRRKKVALFVSPLNPVFAEVRAFEAAIGYSFVAIRKAVGAQLKDAREALRAGSGASSPRHDLLGISHETLRKWGRQEFAPGARVREAIGALQTALLSIVTLVDSERDSGWRLLSGERSNEYMPHLERAVQLVAAFKSDFDEPEQRTSVYAAGRALGVALVDVQRAVDAAIYADRPLLTQPYLDRAEANRDFQNTGGVYYAWIRRQLGATRTWMRCCLHVRYTLEMPNGCHSVRVKLNLPMLYPPPSRVAAARPGEKMAYWEYDGFVDLREQKAFWVLEKRDSYRTDYVYFVTSRRKQHIIGRDSFIGLVGSYLTAHQDAQQSIVSGPVILELMAQSAAAPLVDVGAGQIGFFDEEQLMDFMWRKPSKLQEDDADCERLDRVFDALQRNPDLGM